MGLTLNSWLPESTAGVSGKVPGIDSVLPSFLFSKGAFPARAAVVDPGAAELIMAVVAGASLMMRSVVSTLFSFPLESVSLGAVWSVVHSPSTTNCLETEWWLVFSEFCYDW